MKQPNYDIGRVGFRLSRFHRWSLHGSSSALLLTGVLWQGAHWMQMSGSMSADAGPTSIWSGQLAEASPWLMRGHGAGAMVFLIVLGALIPLHLQRAWLARRNRWSGVGISALCGALILTGYGLYYASSESGRGFHQTVHLTLGIASPAFLIWHLWAGRRAMKGARTEHR